MTDNAVKLFYWTRLGNKQTDLKHFAHLLPKNVKTVIEPYAGTFAVIRNHYFTGNYNRVINDNDAQWFSLLAMMRDDPKKINGILEHLATLKTIAELKAFIKGHELESVIRDKMTNRGMLKKIAAGQHIDELAKLLNASSLRNEDGTKIINEFKDDEDAFIFCDPPYLDSNNTNYSLRKKMAGTNDVIYDNTGMYVDLIDALKTSKAKIMLVINDNALNRYLFDGYIRGKYGKTYAVMRRKTDHLLITNYVDANP